MSLPIHPGPLKLPPLLASALLCEVFSAQQYFGSFVRLRCRMGSLRELEIRIYLADWVLFSDGQFLADCEGSAAANQVAIERLVGQRLQDVSALNRHELWLCFGASLTMKLSANLEEYEPGDELLIASSGPEFVKFSPKRGFETTFSGAVRH